MGRSGRWFGNEPNAPTYVETAYKFTAASDGQTDYGPLLYLPPYLDVFVDGIKLTRAGDVTYSAGTPAASTFSVSAEVAAKVKTGMVVEAIAKVPTRIMDALTQAIADSLYQPLNSGVLVSASIPVIKTSEAVLVPNVGLMTWVQSAGIYRSIDCGQIILHSALNPRAGTVKANGQNLLKSNYPGLWSWANENSLVVSAGSWSAGTVNYVDVDATTFKVPDLRGEFLRSFDDGRGVDSGRTFGTWQNADNAPHSHGVTDPGHAHVINGTANNGNFGAGGLASYPNGSSTTNGATTGISINSSGSEGRPRNTALLACIKV